MCVLLLDEAAYLLGERDAGVPGADVGAGEVVGRRDVPVRGLGKARCGEGRNVTEVGVQVLFVDAGDLSGAFVERGGRSAGAVLGVDQAGDRRRPLTGGSRVRR
ncbi:hypothetical protein [Streptomyces sp. NPDC006668]|uniref:hypothetical protein n=1 Tax=Streptomyces sp. NPDC006668 TaxID=3156903 RepID=UPI0033F31045